MRAAVLALAFSFSAVLLGTGRGLHASAPLSRLAQAFADALAQVARERPLELATPEDRTGGGAGIALDLRTLTADRLQGRVALAESGPRLRVLSVLSQAGRRLVISARVVEEPGGALVDVLSASAEWDDARLGLVPDRPTATSGAVEVVGRLRTSPLEETVLDLVLLPRDRLAVLGAEALSVYRLDGGSLTRESRQPLPGPLSVVRAPAGLLRLTGEGDLWAITSRSRGAALFSLRGERLALRSEAEAVPWPGAPAGLRYRPGTNLVEGEPAGLGPGPFLALLAEPPLAVDEAGQLHLGTRQGRKPAGLRTGPTLAVLWPGLIAASSPEPPGTEDALLLLDCRRESVRLLERLPVDGAVRAVGGRADGAEGRLAAGVEGADGLVHLILLELRRREP